MFDKITKRIISFMTAAVMATSNVMPLTSIIAEENEPDLTYQSMELYPNGEEAEQVVTLDGMMPEGAEAEVIDVSADHEGIAAYDITIKDGRKEYQPDEENPIKVEITDPVITESVTLWHIHDDGDREQVLNFAVEEGKVSFYATGFSVYEIEDKTYNIDISYNKVPVEGDTSFSVMSVDNVPAYDNFEYSVVENTYDTITGTTTKINSLQDFKDNLVDGLYISSQRKGFYAINGQENKARDDNRTGIALTPSFKTNDDNANMTNAYEAGAKKFYFEVYNESNNLYYIYTFADDGVTKKYVGDVTNTKSVFLTNDENNLSSTNTTPTIWKVGFRNNYFYFQDNNNTSWYLSETSNDANGRGFTIYNGGNTDDGAKFSLWKYIPIELTEDPYHLNGKTFGLVNNNDTKGYALMASQPSANSTTDLGIIEVDSGTDSYSSKYGISGWTFEWIPGTLTYYVNARTEDCAEQKYLKLDANVISLVEASEASAVMLTPDRATGRIKITVPSMNASVIRNTKPRFLKEKNTVTTNASYVDKLRYFDLVDVSAASTDVLELDGKTYALINKKDSSGYALSSAPNGTTKAQTVSARTNDAGKTEYVFIGDISQWTFHHIDYNRYTISNGTQYLKLVNGSLAVTNEPYILTVVAGSGDNEGKIKIYNATEKAELYRTGASFTYTTTINDNADRWLDLVTVPPQPTEEIYALDGKTYGLAGTYSNKYYAMSNIAASSTQLSANQLTYNTADETFKCANSLITGWTFHWQGKVNYTISTVTDDGSTKYLKVDNGGVYLVDEADKSTFYIINNNDGKIKICDSATGKNISCGNNVFAQANDSNNVNRYFQLLNIDNQNDPYHLNGETYGLMYYESGTYGNALMDETNNAKLNQIVIREYEKGNEITYKKNGITEWTLEPTAVANKYRLKANNGKYINFNSSKQTISLENSESSATSFEVTTQPDGTTLLYADGKAIILDGMNFYKTNIKGKELYVSKNSDITDWTFENVTEDKYRLKSNGGKYLKMDGDTITMTDSASEATAFKVTPQDGAVMLSAGGKNVYFDGTNFVADANVGSVLKFVQKKTISGEEQLAYSAHAVSIAEPQDGDQVIVYTRVWNNDQKEYEYYAIDYDGSLKRIYPSGNKLVWLDDAVNTLMWEFTVYHYDDGRENGYYELKNTDSDLYIAPQKAKNGQENILQGGTLGIQLPGRTNGEYYSDIIAWDEDDYEYAVIKGDKELGKIKSTYYTDSDKTWYFAVLDESDEDNLHTVETVDNIEHGITMRMYDFTNTRNAENGAQNKLIGGNPANSANPNQNLLSTDLKENGYPDTLKRAGGSLYDLFNAASTAIDQNGFGVQEVNHLFIESIYNTTGYFEFDSCQNTATLVPGGSPVQQTDKDGNPLYVDAEGKLTTESEGNTPIYNFTVYKELGTHDESAGNTRKHGQFFPYNILIPGEYSKANPQNLYNALAQELPDDDPRKYENLYHFAHPNGDIIYNSTGSNSDKMVNCYNGMEMEASFLQTPSGKDAWGHDVIFEFTGDDDFWLYVDGELVIDLGGVHPALAGKVNFATGRVEVNGVKTTLKKVFYDNYKDRNNTKDEALQKLLFNHYSTEYDTYLASQALQYLRSQYNDTTTPAENLISAHQTEYDKYINSHNNKKEKFEYLKSNYFSESFITDNQDEYNGYLSTQHTIEEAQEYVDEIFEWNGDYYDGTINEDNKEYVFKDYTEHHMKIFYMERGAGASNLHMRFNLSSVTEGHVLFNKTVKDMDGNNINNPDFDLNTLEFPFKIQYKVDENDNWTDLRNRDSYDNYVPQVTYQGSTQRVDFADTYVSPRDTSKTYNNVYFLTPGKSLDIDFPDDAVFYRICECAVDPSIFKVATNGEGELTDELGNTVIESGNIQDLYTQSVQVREQPNIKFENRINTENIRHLDITKNLYKDQAMTNEITDDNATFNFRLYISNGTSSELSLAQLRKYYVLDESGNLCKRENGSFVSIEKTEGDKLTDQEKRDVSFYTSMNGSISDIPAGYTVRVPGLVVGTKFMVEEREYENPVGYKLIDFECVQGYKEDDTNHTTPERSYSKDETYQIEENGQLVTKNVENAESAGTIIAKHQADMVINNKKGYGIKADKLWSDKDFAKYHDDIHTAVYIKNGDTETLLPGSVKTIKSPDTSVLYFFDDLSADTNDTKSIDNYIVYEVEVDGSGDVTKKLTALSDEDKTLPSSGNSQIFHAGESESEKNPAEYNVLYPELTDDKRVLSDNARYRKIQNKRKGGISVNLYEWNVTANPDVALSNGKFKLYRGTGDNKKLLGTFTSDESGNITVIYGFEESGTTVFTLEEVSAPTGFESMPEPIMFKVTGTSDNETGKITFEFCKEVGDWSNPNDEEFNEDDKNQTDGKNWAEYKLTPQGEDEFIAKIDIYNPGFKLKAIKVDSETGDIIQDEGTRFALYRSRETAFGIIKDNIPMTGFEDLITGKDVNGNNTIDDDEKGVIEKINNSLPAGTYFLKEISAPSGYEAADEDIGFTISSNGEVSMVNSGQNEYLTKENNTYIISIKNIRTSVDYYFDIEKIIFVDKNIHDSDPEQKFVFKVEQFVEGTTDFTGAPLQVFYVTMNCKDSLTGGYPYANVLPTEGKYTYASADKEVTVTYKTDVSYTFPAAILKGRQTVHVQQDGIYRISEVTEWSGTDYDFWTGSNVYKGYGDGTQDGVAKIADGFKDSKSTGTNVLPTNDANCVYIDVKKLKADCFANETATIDGREATRPKASFTNSETEYTYLSSQAYAENTVKRSST